METEIAIYCYDTVYPNGLEGEDSFCEKEKQAKFLKCLEDKGRPANEVIDMRDFWKQRCKFVSHDLMLHLISVAVIIKTPMINLVSFLQSSSI